MVLLLLTSQVKPFVLLSLEQHLWPSNSTRSYIFVCSGGAQSLCTGVSQVYLTIMTQAHQVDTSCCMWNPSISEDTPDTTELTFHFRRSRLRRFSVVYGAKLCVDIKTCMVAFGFGMKTLV
jgi:hypothetical protein